MMDPFVIYGSMYSELRELLDIATYSKDMGRLIEAIQVLIRVEVCFVHIIMCVIQICL